jgi:hypothetical protein
MRRNQGPDAARADTSLSGTTGALVASLAAVALAVAISAASVYLALAAVMSPSAVPRSTDDWRVLGVLSLAFGAFAAAMATRDELRARREGTQEASQRSSSASRAASASRSRA